jgi:hypothetical protein
MPGRRHGLARGVAVYGRPRVRDDGQIAGLLGRCERLRSWARLNGFVLSGVPEDLELLDRAIDEWPVAAQLPQSNAAPGHEAGLFLGTVIIASLPGAGWRLWPNGHPVVLLPSGRELDVVAIGIRRVNEGMPRLIDAFADASPGVR